MGMYDYLYSRVPLPDSDLPPDTAFQTKDLDCVLAHYLIDADGRLRCCRSIAEDEPDAAGAGDTDYHGDVHFYGHGPDGEWREFVARFTHGTLEWVKRDRDAERARPARRPVETGAADAGNLAERIRARFAPMGEVELEFPPRGPALEPSRSQPADASDLRETPAEAERRVEQARHLKALAREGGLRFTAYLPPGLAEWMLDLVERGVFLDPSEAVFVILSEHRELAPHADLRRELLRRTVQAAIDDPRPPVAAEEVFAELEEKLGRGLPEPAEWRKVGDGR